jgi:hypothetical protein
LLASALVTAARRSRSARICSSIACWMSRGGSIDCSSTRVTSTPQLIAASSITSRMRPLIWSRLASVASSSISPTMLRSVVRVSVSSAYGRFCTA